MFVLVNLYAPSLDSPSFFSKIFGILESLDTNDFISVGDWNMVLIF